MRHTFRLLCLLLISTAWLSACSQGGGGSEQAQSTEQQDTRPSTSDSATTETAELADPYEGMTQAEIMRQVLGTAPFDEFNPDVPEARRGKEEPKPGGVLRVRSPSEFEGFSPLLSSTANSTEVQSFLFDFLVIQDAETLEFANSLAAGYAVGDLFKLPDGGMLEGTIIEPGDENDPNSIVQFVPGAWRWHFNKADVANVDLESGSLTLRSELGGKTYEGKITEQQYVYQVDESASDANKAKIIESRIGDLDTWDDASTGRAKRPFVKRECAFLFPVRQGPQWHDGKPVTAEDAKFGWDTMMNVDVEAQRYRSAYTYVTLCEIVDGNTMHFQASKPMYKNFENLISLYFYPKHIFNPEQYGGDEKAFADAFNSHQYREMPIGNGPFKFAQWKKGDFVRLTRNDNYWKNNLPDGTVPMWRKGQPWLNDVVYIYIQDKTAALKELQKGNLDVDSNVVADIWLMQDANTTQFTNDFLRVKRPGFGWTYVGWNNASPVFSDPATRRAMAMLIPVDQIIRDIHAGLHPRVSGPFFERGPELDKSIKPIEYNPTEAVRQLRRAGWLDRDGDGIIEKEIDGKMVPFEFEYMIHNALDYHQKVADIIKESVEQAGIRMNIRKLDWAVYSDEVRKKNFDAVRFAWTSTPDSDPYQVWHSSQIKNNGDNFLSYRNDRVDELLVAHREEFDPLKRWAMKREMHRLIFDDQPVTFMFSISDLFFIDRQLRNVKLYPNYLPLNFNEWYWADEGRRNERLTN